MLPQMQRVMTLGLRFHWFPKLWVAVSILLHRCNPSVVVLFQRCNSAEPARDGFLDLYTFHHNPDEYWGLGIPRNPVATKGSWKGGIRESKWIEMYSAQSQTLSYCYFTKPEIKTGHP